MKITVCTQAYNAENYIAQCVESVLNQTYSDFQYIVIDNGSTDRTGEIIQQYAANDARIEFIQYEKNGYCRWYDAICEGNNRGDYATTLDADDWLEPDYLERLVSLAEETNSDMVITGSIMHVEKTRQEFRRQAAQRLVLDRRDYAKGFPYYHVFLRPIWGKIVRMSIIKSSPAFSPTELGLSYGTDTLRSFLWLRQCSRICLDNSVLHHYRIHQKSVSHKYDPRQSYSDLYLYNDALDFLVPYGPISAQNQDFLYRVYSNAVLDTNANIKKSDLTPAEKMHEYRGILDRDVTKKAYSSGSDDAVQSRNDLISSVLACAVELSDDNEDFNELKAEYFPECGAAVCAESAKLFLSDSVLFDYLIGGYRKPMVKYILSLIEKQKFVKQYDLPKILCKLSQDKPILAEIIDMKFLKKYSDIYLDVWSGKYSESLDKMTDIMLNETVQNETFLQLYLSLAASLECVDEFIFGKIKLAGFYCSQNRADDCRTILNDLTDMGVEDNDEITKIKKRIAK